MTGKKDFLPEIDFNKDSAVIISPEPFSLGYRTGVRVRGKKIFCFTLIQLKLFISENCQPIDSL